MARDGHYIGVVGAGACEPEVARVAQEVGRLVARAGALLVCGGLGGVMQAGGEFGTLSEIALALPPRGPRGGLTPRPTRRTATEE